MGLPWPKEDEMASQEPGTTPERPTPEEPMPAEPGTMPEQEPETAPEPSTMPEDLTPTRRNRLHRADESSFSHPADYSTEAGISLPAR